MIGIFVDADACPVKDEIYVVATRYGLPVAVVTNAPIYVPKGMGVQLIVVDRGPDAADDWIAENVQSGDVVVTADVPLAARCLAAGASVLGSTGREFDEDSIGGALAMRDLLASRRDAGEATRGPSPLSAKDRSRFHDALDRIVQKNRRTALTVRARSPRSARAPPRCRLPTSRCVTARKQPGAIALMLARSGRARARRRRRPRTSPCWSRARGAPRFRPGPLGGARRSRDRREPSM